MLNTCTGTNGRGGSLQTYHITLEDAEEVGSASSIAQYSFIKQ